MSIDRRSLIKSGIGAATLGLLAGTGTATRAVATTGSVPWSKLSSRLDGTVVLPADAAYPTAKQAYYSQFDVISPRAIAYCVSAKDVSNCLKFARAYGITATPRSGGHSSAGYSTSTGLIVDVSRINTVTVGSGAAVIGAGTQLVDVMNGLSPYGLAIPGGLHPTVGVAGYLQGGGFGFLTRRAGMGCDSMTRAEVVLADGTTVQASATSQADLFWALRGGGGGNFGIVTRFAVRPLAISQLVNFNLTWPWSSAAAVISGWQNWVATAPNELGTQFNIVLPDAAAGAVPLVSVSGAWSGDPAAATAVVDALVAAVGSAPATRREAPLPFRDAMLEWYGCSGRTVGQCHRSGTTTEGLLARGNFLLTRTRMFSAPQPQAGVLGELAAFDSARRAGHTRVLSAAAFGGRSNSVPRTATAYVHRDTQYSLIAATTLPTGTPAPEERAAARGWVDGLYTALDQYSNRETYQNFVDPALPDWRTSYYGENWARLVKVKNDYDPQRFFDFEQAVGR